MSSQSASGQTLSSAGVFSPFLSPSWLATSQTKKRKGFLLGHQLLTRRIHLCRCELPSAVDIKLVPDCLYLLGFHHRRLVWAATRHPPSSSSEHFMKIMTLLHLSNLCDVISLNPKFQGTNSHFSSPLNLFFAPCWPWSHRFSGSRTQGRCGLTVLPIKEPREVS